MCENHKFHVIVDWCHQDVEEAFKFNVPAIMIEMILTSIDH